jgi:hypothetical protein
MMGTVTSLKRAKQPPVIAQMDTLIITPKMVSEWKVPPFQRPIRHNIKVKEAEHQIKKTQTIEGVVTLGTIRKTPTIYIVDGQHRLEAFKLSGIEEAIVDVRICAFDDMTEMSQEFVRLNTSLVKMRPDDILRGLENSMPVLHKIRTSCDFVGYDQIRRGTNGPIVGMSVLIRCWCSSRSETPGNISGSVVNMVGTIDESSLQGLITFLSTAHNAWGHDYEYRRLWGNLNLALCMWLWNRVVIDRDRSADKKYAVLDVRTFHKGLMALSADRQYYEWLFGRGLNEHDRAPAYRKIVSALTRRYSAENKGKRIKLPKPAWLSGYTNSDSEH